MLCSGFGSSPGFPGCTSISAVDLEVVPLLRDSPLPRCSGGQLCNYTRASKCAIIVSVNSAAPDRLLFTSPVELGLVGATLSQLSFLPRVT